MISDDAKSFRVQLIDGLKVLINYHPNGDLFQIRTQALDFCGSLTKFGNNVRVVKGENNLKLPTSSAHRVQWLFKSDQNS